MTLFEFCILGIGMSVVWHTPEFSEWSFSLNDTYYGVGFKLGRFHVWLDTEIPCPESS